MSAARITVLVENTARGLGLLAEHGLAFWIEWPGRKVLFDTGQSRVAAHNAAELGVALEETEAVVLSHGHYDHTGGLAAVLGAGRRPDVYLHPAAMEPKFGRNEDGTARAIGMDWQTREAIGSQAGTLVRTEQPVAVADGLTATGPVPRETDFEDTGGPFFLDAELTRPDPLADDQALFFESAEGTVVLLGCAHAGVINTLRDVRHLTGGRPIAAVLGGMHLVKASPERLQRTIEELRGMDVRLLAPSHCTGMAATAALWAALPGRCAECCAGSRFEFGLE